MGHLVEFGSQNVPKFHAASTCFPLSSPISMALVACCKCNSTTMESILVGSDFSPFIY